MEIHCFVMDEIMAPHGSCN